jgi:Tol biopolymer transport system component/DNA-binding winged helix-turn-helix (wHTH) protein
MLPLQQDNEIYEFRGFRLEIAERRLSREGNVLPLTPKAFDLLVVLVQNDGRLLSKRELMELVWPNQAVEEGNLVNNIYTLRKTLDGSASAEESVIETVPRHGYRFRGNVTALARPSSAAVAPSSPLVFQRVTVTEIQTEEIETDLPSAAEVRDISGRSVGLLPAGRPERSGRWWKTLAGGVVAGAVLLGGVGWWMKRETRPPDGPPPKVRPLTGLRDQELDPAFSPDGTRLAYAAKPPGQDNFDIFITAPGELSPRRVTQTPANESNPVWSPDGKRIAFQRQRVSPDGPVLYDIFIRSLDDGAEKLVATAGEAGFDWSPDGKLFVLNNKIDPDHPLRLHLVEAETGIRRDLQTDPTIPGIDLHPKFSPDGKTLAFCRGVMNPGEIFTIPVNGGPMQRVTTDNARVGRLAWLPNGKEIIYSSDQSGALGLWRVPATGGPSTPVGGVTGFPLALAIDPKGGRLAYQMVDSDLNIWKLAAGSERPELFVGTTQSDDSPQFSPDGRRVAFSSDRSGSSQIWTCNADGSDQKPLTAFVDHFVTGTPRWSPDGKWIAFDSNHGDVTDIFIIPSDGGEPRRLTDGVTVNSLPSWSADGKWIYFCSRRSGPRQLWKIPVAGGAPVQITRDGGWESWATSKAVFYTKKRRFGGIWSVPLDGGPETVVPELADVPGHRYWMATERGIWFTGAPETGRSELKFFDFATRTITTTRKLPALPPFPNPAGLAISPDEKTVLFIQEDQPKSEIMVLENFR